MGVGSCPYKPYAFVSKPKVHYEERDLRGAQGRGTKGTQGCSSKKMVKMIISLRHELPEL